MPQKTNSEAETLSFNQIVETPNGMGFLKEKMLLDGKVYLTVLHLTKQMTSKSEDNGVRLVTNTQDLPTELWAYPIDSVRVAK